MSSTALAILYHDPAGKLDSQVQKSLPLLTDIFAGIAICASPQANKQVLAHWQAAGALIEVESRGTDPVIHKLGMARRTAVTTALAWETSHILYCDGDRVVHWAEHYPEELRATADRIQTHDFTVLGRTARAFQSHPGVQRDTESIINKVFAHATGWHWDLGSGSRGLSRRAVAALNEHCADDTIAVDATWPLCLHGHVELGYFTVDGLEFETGDGYGHQKADGDYQTWLSNLDSDPRRWAYRLQVAQLMVEKIAEYTVSMTQN